MIKTLVCKKCERTIKVDFSKAPKDKFTIACPGCQQKYQLEKPKLTDEKNLTSGDVKSVNLDKIKNIPCPKCKSGLKVDFSRIEKFPAVIQCRSCETKIKLNDPNAPKKIETGNLDHLAKDKAKFKIDKDKIDPKNNWAYRVYFYTRKINYLNKVTLLVYMGYLVRSIAKSLSNVSIETINPESFLKLCAETNVVSVNAFNSVVNPILKENGISPKLSSWASNWFVKKISQRIVLGILKSKKVDMTLPFIKKYVETANKENAAIKRIITNEYAIYLYVAVLLYVQYSYLNRWLDFMELMIFEALVVLPVFLMLRYLEFFRTVKIYSLLFLVFFLQYVINTQIRDFATVYEAYADALNIFIPFFFIILIVSFVGEKLERHSLQPNFFHSRISQFIFRPTFSLAVLIIPFSGLTSFYALSRHEITQEEFQAFEEMNSDFSGDWYFTDEDEAVLNTLRINRVSATADNSDRYSGMLNAFYSYSIIDENENVIGEGTMDTIISYDSKITMPLSITKGLKIISKTESSLNVVVATDGSGMKEIKCTIDKQLLEAKVSKNKNGVLIKNFIGVYTGAFGDNEIGLEIISINPKTLSVTGSNSVAGNSRPLKGTIEILDNVCYFVLNEPGDDQYDGVFEFKIYKNSNTSLEGTWRSNDGTLTRDYRLYRL